MKIIHTVLLSLLFSPLILAENCEFQLAKSGKESDKSKDLGEELADVIFVVLCLANQTGVDLQAAFDAKLELKTKRDHDRHHANNKLK